MSRESLVLVLGVLILFVPWLGVPDTWKLVTLTVSGVLLIVLGYLLRRAAYLRRIDIGGGERGTDSFIESSVEDVSVDAELSDESELRL